MIKGERQMKLRYDDIISTLVAVTHYKYDREDPDFPDLYCMIVTDAMLRTFEVLGLAIRSKHESGDIIWCATPELTRLANGIFDIKQTGGSTRTDNKEASGT
jgi:hypothetical protein